MSLLDIIRPIELLFGSHPDAKDTGRGCLMNVVSYLNGDREITDRPACACEVITPIAIYLNDFMTDAERAQLLPYVLSISGSRTTDQKILSARAWACVRFAEWQRDEAAGAAGAARAANAAAWAASAAARAAWAASAASAASAAASAANAAAWAALAADAADAADAAYRQRSITRCLSLLDEMLSLTETPAETPAAIKRAQRYVELSAKADA